MTNIEKLEQIGILKDVRIRMGAEDGNDKSRDNLLNGATNEQLIALWCAYNLGDSEWWTQMKHWFDQLEEMDKKNNG